MAHRAEKLNSVVAPLGYRAVPQPHQTITWNLVALTNQATRELSWAIRIPVAADPTRGRWEPHWAYQISELLTEAESAGVASAVVFTPDLKPNKQASVVPAGQAYEMAVTGHRNWLDRNIKATRTRLTRLERDLQWWLTEHPELD